MIRLLYHFKYSLKFSLLVLSWIMPRKKNRWLFGCAFGFCDNPKYLFLDALQNSPHIESWWISKTKVEADALMAKGINAVYAKSLKGYYLCLTAKVYIYSHHTSDINFFTSGNAFKVNLWHGIALKEIEWGIKESSPNYKWFDGTLSSRFNYPYNYEKHDFLLVAGPFFLEDFKYMFRVSEEQMFKHGYPRCAIFDKSEIELENLIKLDNEECQNLYKKIKAARKTYIYMPTFRDDDRDFFQESGIDIKVVNDVLKSRSDLLIIKFHPATLSKLKNLPVLSNVHFVNTKLDIYPLLPFTDVLITDYSSIYFDYLLLKKGIILFPFDYEQYIRNSRGFIHNYDDVFFGTRCMIAGQLMDIFRQDRDVRMNEEELSKLISQYWYKESNGIIKAISDKVGC